eukprot:MONOS_10361.1-p1 / transcript=MONOS_10361.1 / gene=MONOS_10361 / organism=Monocercomonoides_exilis_PA203 / gene_product=unspecified product / transcript_product=unspecified product / location=Mono_scaffold00468:2967-3937(-) / protein_length=304 / sequence_SO=supercontig / SO=protein_coding / is_pseudo=false
MEAFEEEDFSEYGDFERSESDLSSQSFSKLQAWHPALQSQKQTSYDVDIGGIDYNNDNILQIRKEEMVEGWKARELALWKKEEEGLLNESEKGKKKMLMNRIVNAEIKEAKHFFKLFGEWVRKDWIIDENEALLWSKAEERARTKEGCHFEKDEFNIEDKTIEELGQELRDAGTNSTNRASTEHIAMQLSKKEKKLNEQITMQEMSYLERDRFNAIRRKERIKKQLFQKRQSRKASTEDQPHNVAVIDASIFQLESLLLNQTQVIDNDHSSHQVGVPLTSTSIFNEPTTSISAANSISSKRVS